MIKGKARRAHEDFLKALQIQAQNHALEAIEFLTSELDDLNALFDKNNLGINISGNWVLQNMSYAAEMSVKLAGKEASLLKLTLTPLRLNDVLLVAQHGMYNGNDIPRSHKTYKKLDDGDGVAKLYKAVRNHIEMAIPAEALEMAKAIMQEPDAIDIADGHIESKYGQPIVNAKGRTIFDPKEAYKLALYYQEEQQIAGIYARMP